MDQSSKDQEVYGDRGKKTIAGWARSHLSWKSMAPRPSEREAMWPGVDRIAHPCFPSPRTPLSQEPLILLLPRICPITADSSESPNYFESIRIRWNQPRSSPNLSPETGLGGPSLEGCFWWDLHFNVPSQGSTTQRGLLAVNCASFWPHFSSNSTAWAPIRRLKLGLARSHYMKL